MIADIVGIGEGIYLVPLIITVFIGGMLGSYMVSFKFSAKTMDKILGSVILVAIFSY